MSGIVMNSHPAIFAQYRLSREALSKLSESAQQEFQYQYSQLGWSTDAQGRYFSALLPLPTPEWGQRELEVAISLPVTDQHYGALIQEIQQQSEVQLVAFDFYYSHPRGPERVLVETSVFSGEYGEELQLNSVIPHPLLAQLRILSKHQERLPTPHRYFGYRYILKEVVYTGYAELVYIRSKRLHELKHLVIYQHTLRTGAPGEFIYCCTTSACYHRDAPYNEHNTLPQLRQQEMRGLALRLLEGVERTTSSSEYHTANENATRLYQNLFREEERVKREQEESERRKQEAEEKLRRKQEEIDRKRKEAEEALKRKEEEKPKEKAGLPAEAFDPLPDHFDESEFAQQLAGDRALMRTLRVYLEEGHNLLLVGPPGCGKTHLATLLAEQMCGRVGQFRFAGKKEAEREYRCHKDERRCRPDRCAKYSHCFEQGDWNFSFVTADARWTSLDVVGGLKAKAGQGLQYGYVPGVVTQAVQKHRHSQETLSRPHYLVVDEFNRANQDEAFGRLFTVLDQRYRERMPLSSREENGEADIFMPKDFRIIATMNDQDSRSLYPIGAALLRRFVRIDISIPQNERLWISGQHYNPDTVGALYHFIGEAHDWERREGERVRSFYPMGTSFMRDTLDLAQHGISLDRAIADKIVPHLSGLHKSDLQRLAQTAEQQRLEQTRLKLVALAREQEF